MFAEGFDDRKCRAGSIIYMFSFSSGRTIQDIDNWYLDKVVNNKSSCHFNALMTINSL